MSQERKIWRGFASDNYAGVHPDVMAAMLAVNEGHEVAYGDDSVTARLDAMIQAEFGPQALAQAPGLQRGRLREGLNHWALF